MLAIKKQTKNPPCVLLRVWLLAGGCSCSQHCQVAEPIAFPPGLIQIASSASLHTESVSAIVNRNDSEETPAPSGPHLTTASENNLCVSGAGGR